MPRRPAAGPLSATCSASVILTATLACLALTAGALEGQRPVPPVPPTSDARSDSGAAKVTALVGVQRFHFEQVGTAPEIEVRVEKRIDGVLHLGGSLAGSWRDYQRNEGQIRRNEADRFGFLVFLTSLARLEVPGRVSPWVEAGAGFFANSNYDALMDGTGIAGHVGTGISADVADGWRLHFGYRLRKVAVEVGGTTHTLSIGVTLPAGPFGAPGFEPPDRFGG